MELRITDINEFEAIVKLADELPTNERVLFKAVTGLEFDTEEFMGTLAEMAEGLEHQYTFWAGEKPIAAGGFLPQRPGVFRTWFMAPEWAWKEHGRELTDVCRELIARLFRGKLAHRVETVTLADRAEARAWYERIGLAYESTLRGYGANGEDAVMYVALRPDEEIH